MTRQDVVNKLSQLYLHAKDREKAVTIHLFGIRYAEFLKGKGSIKKIAEEAGIPVSYATEISKGMKLSKFVEVNSDVKI